MRVGTHEIVLGVYDDPEENFRTFKDAGELGAIETATGVASDTLTDTLTAAARESCPNANCCLDILHIRGSEEIPGWVDDRDDTQHVQIHKMRVRFHGEKDGCADRAEVLTQGLAKAAKTCIDAIPAAEKADQKAKAPFYRTADDILRFAEIQADEERRQGDRKAQDARMDVRKVTQSAIRYRRRRLRDGKS